MLVISFLALPQDLIATDVLITNTRSSSPTQLMDLNWKRAANLLGLTNEIIPHSDLDSLHFIQDSPILIIASGVENISNQQQAVVLEYIKNGGHVYVQSEFRINFAGNQLFEYLVNKSGGSFAWEGETNSNLNPANIPSYIQDDNSPALLDYFWNGTYGCGGKQIFPLISYDEKDYGFIFQSDETHVGRIMTMSDQDWIKIATETGQAHRLEYMRVLLDVLANGIENLIVPRININSLQKSICPDTPFDIEALIDETVLDHDIEWFKNGLVQEDWFNKRSFTTDELIEGDVINAHLYMYHGCTDQVIESNFIEIERVFPLNLEMLNIVGATQLCSMEQGIYVAETSAMPDPSIVSYTWKIDGVDQMIDNDTLRIANPQDGSVITMEASYDDMCQMVVKQASNTIDLEVVGNPQPKISLRANKDGFCLSDMATILLEGLPVDIDVTITWNVDGNPIELNETQYVLSSLTNDHQVFASITYEDECEGTIKLSTQVLSITIAQPTLKIIDKQSTSCDLDNGTITVEVEGGTGPFSYIWEGMSVDNHIIDLPIGPHTIEVEDTNGCTADAKTTIGSDNPQIIDSLVIDLASCESDAKSSVQLFTNPSFDGALDISWKDGSDDPIDLNVSGGLLASGNYTVSAVFNEDCMETKPFEVGSGNLMEGIQTQFDTEAEFFITLDLGIPVTEIATISWNDPDGVLDCTDCTWPSMLATKSRSFNVDIMSTAGCTNTVSVQVNVKAAEKLPYFAPSGFSPDGDGLNDTYDFFVDETKVQFKELIIFDRWGNLAYMAKTLEEVNWDGRVNGAIADRGVYAYVAKMVNRAGEEIVVSGSIMIVR